MNNGERVLADLELTRGLTIQMLAIGTIGMVVGWSVFATLYQVGTGQPVSLQLVPSSFGWLETALNVLLLVVLGTIFIVPHEWLHGLAIRYYGGEPRYGVGVAHFILPYAYARTTAHLGGLDLDFRDRDDRRTVRSFWTVFCEKHRRSPMVVAKPLRLLGLHWEPAGKRYVAGLLADLR